MLIPELLFYLISQRKVRGDNGQVGFVALPRLYLELETLGFVHEDIKDAAHFCLRKELVEVDTSSVDAIREQVSLKATASGWAHMRLLSSRAEYIASLLPTTPLNDKQFSARVFDLMQAENRSGSLAYYQVVQLVEGFAVYLRRQSAELAPHPGFSGRSKSGSSYILGKVQEALTFARKNNAQVTGQPDLLDL